MKNYIYLLFVGGWLIGCASITPSADSTKRKTASVNISIDEKLTEIHDYYTLAQYHLIEFDQDLKKMSLEDLYQGEHYLSLLFIRSEVESVEHEILDSISNLKTLTALDLNTVMAIKKFSEKSHLKLLSMENLIARMDLAENGFLLKSKSNHKLNYKFLKFSLGKELKKLRKESHFIELESKVKNSLDQFRFGLYQENKKFFPATSKEGNITGNEFPQKVWSLTFDDGPGKNTSPLILASLKDRNLKATFFQLSSVAKRLPLVAGQIKDAGMEIASHSATHPQIPKLDDEKQNMEITVATQDLESMHGVDIKFFRLPYGAGVNNNSIRSKIANSGLIHVFWNIDTLDWMAQEPNSIVERTIEQMKKTPKDAGVILFHDIHSRTTLAAPVVMDYLKKDGRRVCTLDTITSQMNEGKETVCPAK